METVEQSLRHSCKPELPGKAFRNLVPSELQQSLRCINSAQPFLLTLPHRTGVSPYTSSYDLAETCVFTKQSPLLNSVPLFSSKKVPVPKLQGHFAEFLQYNYSSALVHSHLPTCVGFRTIFYYIFFL